MNVRHRRPSAQAVRALRAVLGIALAFAMIGVIGTGDADGSRDAAAQLAVGATALDALSGDVADPASQLFGQLGGFSVPSSQLSEAFEAELFGAGTVAAAQTSVSGGVVGFICPGCEADVRPTVGAALADKGWLPVGSVQDGTDSEQGRASVPPAARTETYVKDSGRYRWAYLSYQNVSDAVSIVVIAKD